MTLKIYRHAPAHLLLDEQFYFFTGAVYQKRPFLETDQAKEIFKQNLFRFHEKFGWTIKEWAVLHNHYHFLSWVPRGKEVPRMINVLHKTSVYHIKRHLNLHIDPFWYQYWDRCIRDEKDYVNTAGYILFNPLKHGLVEDMRNYRYSSFHERFQEEGESLMEGFERIKTENISYLEEMDHF